MKKDKTSKSLRLIAFFLVGLILVCAFGFSVDGWDFKKNTPGTPQQNNGTPNTPTQDDKIQSDTSSDENINQEESPKFFNKITGEETTEELSNTRHVAFVISPSAPLYGVSSADLLIEFPIEDGETRLLSFINDPRAITKLGSLSKTRDYISNLAAVFNSSIFATGNDDSIEYSKCDIDERLTLEENVKPFTYTEFARYTYTGGELLTKALSTNPSASVHEDVSLPFLFNEGDAPIKGNTCFNKVTIPYANLSHTSLTFYSEHGTYFLDKNNSPLSDLSNGSRLAFKNCFILFADSTTYETQSSTQMVLNTLGEGSGYYFTEGTARQITWKITEHGSLMLYDEEKNSLIINKGKSFISFVKSSKIDEIILS